MVQETKKLIPTLNVIFYYLMRGFNLCLEKFLLLYNTEEKIEILDISSKNENEKRPPTLFEIRP